MFEFLKRKPDPLVDVVANQNKFLETMHASIDKVPGLEAQNEAHQCTIIQLQNEIKQLQASKTDMENKLAMIKPVALLQDSATNALLCEIYTLAETVYPEYAITHDLGKMQIEIMDHLSNGQRVKHDRDKLNAAIYQCLLSYRAVSELYQ